jgi:hypothetical protein
MAAILYFQSLINGRDYINDRERMNKTRLTIVENRLALRCVGKKQIHLKNINCVFKFCLMYFEPHLEILICQYFPHVSEMSSLTYKTSLLYRQKSSVLDLMVLVFYNSSLLYRQKSSVLDLMVLVFYNSSLLYRQK